MRDLVIERLDQLFALGEFGLAYHLSLATMELMPDFDIIYDPIEFRLAAAAGRFSGLSGQEVEALLEARNEARAIVQKFEGEEDARSIARGVMLLGSAAPAALFRQDDTGAAGLVAQIGAAGLLRRSSSSSRLLKKIVSVVIPSPLQILRRQQLPPMRSGSSKNGA